jgi:hypothetical protein
MDFSSRIWRRRFYIGNDQPVETEKIHVEQVATQCQYCGFLARQ